MKLRRATDDVYFADEPSVRIGPSEIAFIIEQAAVSSRRRARICLHGAEDDAVQEMLIAVRSESYVRPHRHLTRSESFHALAGAADILLFDDLGAVTDHIRLADDDRAVRILRVRPGMFHMLIARTPTFVLHETTSGPFTRSGTEYAAWSPEEGDAAGIARYLAKVEAVLAR